MRYKLKSIVCSFVFHGETTSCCFYVLFSAAFGIGEGKFKVTEFFVCGGGFLFVLFCFYFSLLIPSTINWLSYLGRPSCRWSRL